MFHIWEQLKFLIWAGPHQPKLPAYFDGRAGAVLVDELPARSKACLTITSVARRGSVTPASTCGGLNSEILLPL